MAGEWRLKLFDIEKLTEYLRGGVVCSLYVRCMELVGFQIFGE